MKQLLFLSILCLPLVGEKAWANELDANSDAIEKRIHKGDMSVDGSFSADYTSQWGLTLRANVSYQYFFADKFSGGLVYKHAVNSDFHLLSVGPKFTYYFYEGNRWALYVSQDLVHNNQRYKMPGLQNRSFLSATTSVGADYFITPNVALGAQLYFTNKFNMDSKYSDPTFNQQNDQAFDMGLLLGFKIFF